MCSYILFTLSHTHIHTHTHTHSLCVLKEKMWKAEDVRKELETVTREEVREFVKRVVGKLHVDALYQVCVCVWVGV